MMVPDRLPNYWREWLQDFIADWRLELEAPDEFWTLMAKLSPSQVRLVREVLSGATASSFQAGSGEPAGR